MQQPPTSDPGSPLVQVPERGLAHRMKEHGTLELGAASAGDQKPSTSSRGGVEPPTAAAPLIPFYSLPQIVPSRPTLLSRLNQEIQTVLALIQQNSAWSGTSNPFGLRLAVPPRHLIPLAQDPAAPDPAAEDLEGRTDGAPRTPVYLFVDIDEEEEELLGEELVALELRAVRAQMFSWKDWSEVDPLTYLMPFLYAIRSPLTSTPVTAAALLSVHSILTTGFFTTKSQGAALAMHVLVDSVTSCRFEVRDVVSEELVLMRILHVLLACLQCAAAPLLSDRAVCTVVNTCFRVLHQSAAKGELLQRMAAQVMREMIRTIFVKLPPLAAAEAAAIAAAQEEEGEEEEEEEEIEVALVSSPVKGPVVPLVPTLSREDKSILGPLSPSLSRTPRSSSSKREPEPKFPIEESDGSSEEEAEEEAEGEDEDEEQKPLVPAESEATEQPEQEQQGELEPQQPRGTLVEVGRPQGISCMVEIFQFLCSLLSVEDQYGAPLMLGGGASEVSTGEEDSNVPLFALQLIGLALELGGDSVSLHPKLLLLVQDSLLHSLLHLACTSPSLPMIALVCNTVLHLYLTLRTRLKLQLEAFLDFALVRLAQEKYSISPQHQEVALEALVDLCRLPSFAVEMYANFDCELSATNTFEDICTQLSRAAFPVSLPLNRLHVLALRGLLALLHHMSLRVDAGPAPKPPPPPTLKAQDPKKYPLLWKTKTLGPDPEDPEDVQRWVTEVRRRKHIKRRLMAGAEQFNRDPARGLLYLQTYHLLPPELDAPSVACFLRFTPGINKTVLGTFLGDHDTFKIDVLQQFVKLFDFSTMTLDAALRIFLESFRLPGEAQKISRILEAFADRYFQQCRTILANKDAAYILAYSVIMLNTDQHNGQVRKKMTEEEFIRNNRSINDGRDLPRGMLSDLYHSIVRDEIRVSTDALPGHLDMTQSRWMEILRKAAVGAMTPYVTYDECSPLLDYDMFSIIAGPTVAAISVVFDNAEDEEVLRQCVAGFTDAAKVCAAHCMRDTLDDLVVSLCKFTGLLLPMSRRDEREDEEAVRFFAGDVKARLAAGAMFAIASRYGDYVRTGWRNILDCVLRLHKLGLLPARVLQEARDAWAGGSAVEARAPNAENAALSPSGASALGAPTPSGLGPLSPLVSTGQQGEPFLTTLDLSRAQGIVAGRKKGKGFMSRFSELLLGGQSSEYEEFPEEARDAQQQVLAAVADWHIEAIFADSKFLQADSLLHLAKALIWAATRAQGGLMQGAVSPSSLSGSESTDREEEKEDEDTAVFCLDLLFGVTLANRDRISLLWPAVAEHLSSIILVAVPPPSVLVAKAVLGMLRVCQRLLAYKEDVADELLRSLQMILKMDIDVANALCPKVTKQALLLVQSYSRASDHTQSGPAWRTVFLLLCSSARHPSAADIGLEAVRFVLGDKRHLSHTNFMPCVDLAIDFATASAPGPAGLKRAVVAMELLRGMGDVLVDWAEEERKPQPSSPRSAESDALVTGGGWVVVQKDSEAVRVVSAEGQPAAGREGDDQVGELAADASQGSRPHGLTDLWLKLVLSTSRACSVEHREPVRQAGIRSLEKAVLAGRKIGVPSGAWLKALDEGVFSLVGDVLVAALQGGDRRGRSGSEARPVDTSLELALQLQCRAVLAGATSAIGPLANAANASAVEREAIAEELLTEQWKTAVDNIVRYLTGPPKVSDERLQVITDSLLRPTLAEAISTEFLILSKGEGSEAEPAKDGAKRWGSTWRELANICPGLTVETLVVAAENGSDKETVETAPSEGRAITAPA